MHDDANQVDESNGMRVGDHVRVIGGMTQRSDSFVIIGLHAVEALGPEGDDVVAVIRDEAGAVYQIITRRLAKL